MMTLFRTFLVSLLIVLNTSSFDQNSFQKYTQGIAGSDLTITLMPIKGGAFLMGGTRAEGSPSDELPRKEIEVSDFWMSDQEISWNLFELFLYRETDDDLSDDKEINIPIDGVSGATMPYVNFNKPDRPVINITHYAASTFCKWLTAKTGCFYRLPTEAEWEYAARAGTNTPYFFDRPEDIDDYAWHGDNSNSELQKGGQKSPNPWGLYDMYGNAAEWVIDGYSADFYSKNTVSKNPVNFPKELYPRVVRGGSFKDRAENLRSASRQHSSKKWKRRDPQIPKSLWWLTDATHVGFRIVRPKEVPPESEWEKYWGKPIKEY